MSLTHSCWAPVTFRSALRCGSARNRAPMSMATSRAGRASTASPTHSLRRASGRAADPWAPEVASCMSRPFSPAGLSAATTPPPKSPSALGGSRPAEGDASGGRAFANRRRARPVGIVVPRPTAAFSDVAHPTAAPRNPGDAARAPDEDPDGRSRTKECGMTTTARAAEVVVEMWLPRYPAVPLYISGIRRLAASFQELHPEYVISVRESSYKTLPEDVDAASRQGRAPALVQYFHTSTQLARDMLTASGAPLFTSVHEAIDGRTEILGHPVVTGDILATARAYYSYDGALMAVPPLISTTLLYANTDLLQAAGVTRLPQTWDEVDGACEAVRALPGLTHGITWPNNGWIFQQADSQSGGLLADN